MLLQFGENPPGGKITRQCECPMNKHLIILPLQASRLSLSRFLLRICGNCMVGVLQEFLLSLAYHTEFRAEVSTNDTFLLVALDDDQDDLDFASYVVIFSRVNAFSPIRDYISKGISEMPKHPIYVQAFPLLYQYSNQNPRKHNRKPLNKQAAPTFFYAHQAKYHFRQNVHN